jgi:Uma2 family endonuclease
MAETEIHYDVMTELIAALRRRYRDVPDVWVGGNLFLCYEEGNPRAAVAPDVVMAKGIGKYRRDNYLLWQERPPSLVVEVTSRSTRSEDTNKKKGIYERIGVEEYILFDPRAEYLKPPLQGYRLVEGRYRPILPGPDGSISSLTTGLRLLSEGDQLRLVDAATGEPLLRMEEQDRALEAAQEETARLRRELERRSGLTGRQNPAQG